MRQRRTHSARCAENRRNSPGAVLGTGAWPYVPVIMQRQVPSSNSGSGSFQFIDRMVASLWTETGTLGKLWRLHRCSSWTRCSRTVLAHRQGRRCASDQLIWLLFDIFIDFEIQFGRVNAVFTVSSSPLDDDDEGLGDDDDQGCSGLRVRSRRW